MNVDIRGIEPISFVWQSLVRSNLGAPKSKFKKGFGGFIASMSKPEMHDRFRGKLEFHECQLTENALDPLKPAVRDCWSAQPTDFRFGLIEDTYATFHGGLSRLLPAKNRHNLFPSGS